MTRTTDWIMTASGRPFWPLEPAAEDVSIEDIAHHLSHLCRFTGAVREFYSVAQHSVIVSLAFELAHAQQLAHERRDPPCHKRPVVRWCDHRGPGGFMGHTCGSRLTQAQAALYGLLHDASEAYLVDVPRPLKHSPGMAPYRVVEARLQTVIYRSFGLALDHGPHGGEPALLKRIDRRALRAEQRDLMPPPALDERRDDVPPLEVRIVPWAPAFAKWKFLARFAALTGEARPVLREAAR